MSAEKLRQELYEAFKHRALIYHAVFEELRQELGPERAEELLSRAIYRRGQQRGRSSMPASPRDLAGLKAAFLAGSADEGNMFQLEVLRDDAHGLDIKHHACPLRDAWQEAGLPAEDVATSAASPRGSTTGRSRRPAFSSGPTPGSPAAKAAVCCTSARAKNRSGAR